MAHMAAAALSLVSCKINEHEVTDIFRVKDISQRERPKKKSRCPEQSQEPEIKSTTIRDHEGILICDRDHGPPIHDPCTRSIDVRPLRVQTVRNLVLEVKLHNVVFFARQRRREFFLLLRCLCLGTNLAL
jgi:hypothetical protein